MNILPVISLLLVLGAVALVLYTVVVLLLSRALTRPRRLTAARALARVGRMSPSDLSLPFESIDFQVMDQHGGKSLRLSAWWIPHPTSDACAILLHGYADAKIGAIAWAPLLQRLGYNVLAIDHRAHGESEGRDITAGYFERHDVSQVIDQIKLQRPAQTKSIILFGISMGAAIAAATAAVREDLTAIILDSPYARFRDAARTHADLTGLPGESFLALAWKISTWRTGANFEEVDPAETVCKAKCPVLLIAANRDVLVPVAAQNCLQSSLSGRGDCSRVWAMEADHVLGYAADPQAYVDQLRNFLDEVIAGEVEEKSNATAPL